MGFTKTTPPPTQTQPPTVTETVESDTRNDYSQRASRKRGLLSTILSNRRQSAATGSAAGNKTLG